MHCKTNHTGAFWNELYKDRGLWKYEAVGLLLRQELMRSIYVT
jgi:hypothetical protein